LRTEVDNIIQIDKLKASLNQIAKEKAEQEQLGSQKLSLVASKKAEIEKLKVRLDQMIQIRNHEYESGNFYYNRFNQRSLELQEERKKYASLVEKYDEILANVCGCTRCRNNQTPNNWADILSTGRNVEKETNTEVLWKTTTVNTPTIH
jgi:molybdopterin converting factor small subunit